MKTVKNTFILWMIVMFLVTFTCLLVYLVAQQSLRLGANELPSQLAIETSIKLQNGQSIKEAIPTEKVNIEKSLNAFVMVYDSNKILIATSGIIGNSQLVYPKGVLDNVSQKGEVRVTWQPATGLRFATVAIKYNNEYIVAAHSLSETEKLIDKLGELVFLSWLACAAFSAFVLAVICVFMKKINRSRKLS
ncbi:MAG TPA: hypothetical protein VIK78_04960 [Ruminiclostridium sp.]